MGGGDMKLNTARDSNWKENHLKCINHRAETIQ